MGGCPLNVEQVISNNEIVKRIIKQSSRDMIKLSDQNRYLR